MIYDLKKAGRDSGLLRMIQVSILAAGACIAAADGASNFHAEQYARKTIYHSPQKPGYSSWVGAWIMPDDSLMVSFHQATGPVEGRGVKDYDYSGLQLANVYLRSTDGG